MKTFPIHPFKIFGTQKIEMKTFPYQNGISNNHYARNASVYANINSFIHSICTLLDYIKTTNSKTTKTSSSATTTLKATTKNKL